MSDDYDILEEGNQIVQERNFQPEEQECKPRCHRWEFDIKSEMDTAWEYMSHYKSWFW